MSPPLVAFAVPANLLAQSLVQRFATGFVFCLSLRGVLGSASLVVGVDLLRVFTPPPCACLGADRMLRVVETRFEDDDPVLVVEPD